MTLALLVGFCLSAMHNVYSHLQAGTGVHNSTVLYLDCCCVALPLILQGTPPEAGSMLQVVSLGLDCPEGCPAQPMHLQSQDLSLIIEHLCRHRHKTHVA